MKPKITSLDDLVKDQSVFGITLHNSNTQRFYESLKDTRYASIWDTMKNHLIEYDKPGLLPPWMETVDDGQAIFTGDSKYLTSMVGKRFSETGKCGIRVSTHDMGSTYIGIAFRKEFRNTNILKQFNRGLRRFTEGDLAHFRMLYSNRHYDLCTTDSTSVARPLNLKDLSGAFFVLITGLSISTIVFFFELLTYRKSKNRVHCKEEVEEKNGV